MTDNEAVELHIDENLHRIVVVEEFLRMNPGRDDKEGKKTIQILTKTNGLLQEAQKYRAIGTVSECREAVEKQRAKKPDLTGYDEQDYYKCPSCGGELASLDDYFPKQPYCADCGQAILWERDNE